jgi:hypothetical protein
MAAGVFWGSSDGRGLGVSRDALQRRDHRWWRVGHDPRTVIGSASFRIDRRDRSRPVVERHAVTL